MSINMCLLTVHVDVHSGAERHCLVVVPRPTGELGVKILPAKVDQDHLVRDSPTLGRGSN